MTRVGRARKRRRRNYSRMIRAIAEMERMRGEKRKKGEIVAMIKERPRKRKRKKQRNQQQ